jgi:hypothetical protein
LAVQLIAQGFPIQRHEGMLLGNFPHQIIGNSRAGSQPGQMELPHFSAAAHVVHQVKRISFAADKSHDGTSNFRYLL